MSEYRICWVIIAAGVLVMQVVPGRAAEPGRISVTVTEEGGGQNPLPCRAWVEVGTRRYFEPQEKDCAPYNRDRSLSCDGRFTVEVPAGRAVVHVERGKEYWPVDREIAVAAGQTNEVSVAMKRWVNLQEEGWYSADMHVHFGAGKLPVLKQLAQADDVNWLPVFSCWNEFPEKWPAWPEGASVRVTPNYLVTMANEEIERIGGERFHSVGALFIFGLKEPVFVTRHDHQYPCDAALARMARKTTPECVIDTDKPLWAENVVTMGLGLFDSVQVCHNHYHRNSDYPLCCGMVGAEIEDDQDWGKEELFVRTNTIYYRWLNCGFKLAVSGGAAMGVMPVPLGYSRTYAKLDGPLTEANYVKAIRAGRTFATSGPMLTMTVDGQDVGAVFQRAAGQSGPLKIQARLRSVEPVDSLELLHDGQVIGHVDLIPEKPSPVLERLFEASLSPSRSGWVAARAVYRAPTGRLRQAHTSPVYFIVDGKPIASRRDAEYMIRWIDRILAVSDEPGRYQSDQDRAECQAIFREARAVYEGIAATASKVWGD